MNNEDFEKRYDKFLRKYKSSIVLKLWEEKSKLSFELGDYIKSLDIISKIQIPMFIIGGIIFSKYNEDGPVVLAIITFIIWIGLMLWFWFSLEKAKDDICNYVFDKYLRNRVIEKYVRWLESEYKDDTEDILDSWEEKYFYDKCIENLKYYENLKYKNCE